MNPDAPDLVRPFRTASGAMARLVILCGALALAGWLFDAESLKRVLPGLTAMNPLTATVFIVSGAALRLLREDPAPPWKRGCAGALASFVILIGILRLAGCVLGWDCGLDQLMFADKLAAGPGLPNRMAPNTAACFILSGAALALLASDGPGRLAWSQALALPAAVISLTALVGYAYGAKRLYAVGSFIPMAANTAAAFFLLSLGTLLSRPGQGVARPCVSAGPGGVLLRLLAPSTLVIMVALGWLRLLGERAGLYGAEFGTALHVILCWLVIAWLLWRVASALDQTAEVRVRAEERVRSYAARLEAANKELESFSYSVSHDLRAPLRAVDGFSQILAEDCGDKLDDRGRDHLRRVREGCRRMAELIDGLLELSRVTRREMRREPVDLAALGRAVARQLSGSAPERNVEFIMPDKLPVRGDPTLLRAVLDNLIANAWKFTGNRQGARIELGVCAKNGVEACFVRDNGAGFDMAYADKLFGAFQRLHSTSEFPGWGVGLATVWRIVGRHGGRVWAEGSVGQGATFYFTLGGGHETE